MTCSSVKPLPVLLMSCIMCCIFHKMCTWFCCVLFCRYWISGFFRYIIHILQDYFTGIGAIIWLHWLPQGQWSNPERYGYNQVKRLQSTRHNLSAHLFVRTEYICTVFVICRILVNAMMHVCRVLYVNNRIILVIHVTIILFSIYWFILWKYTFFSLSGWKGI